MKKMRMLSIFLLIGMMLTLTGCFGSLIGGQYYMIDQFRVCQDAGFTYWTDFDADGGSLKGGVIFRNGEVFYHDENAHFTAVAAGGDRVCAATEEQVLEFDKSGNLLKKYNLPYMTRLETDGTSILAMGKLVEYDRATRDMTAVWRSFVRMPDEDYFTAAVKLAEELNYKSAKFDDSVDGALAPSMIGTLDFSSYKMAALKTKDYGADDYLCCFYNMEEKRPIFHISSPGWIEQAEDGDILIADNRDKMNLILYRSDGTAKMIYDHSMDMADLTRETLDYLPVYYLTVESLGQNRFIQTGFDDNAFGYFAGTVDKHLRSRLIEVDLSGDSEKETLYYTNRQEQMIATSGDWLIICDTNNEEIRKKNMKDGTYTVLKDLNEIQYYDKWYFNLTGSKLYVFNEKGKLLWSDEVL
ncbi:hypothetical protein [Candidatus Soleaferrea massiliensis]|uniref:hypothetical protein n=1 Tax=Candidatus Soleaferrea massiliensis TaxID=1470354 RepID=UPI00058F7554|nr:hypothetical protein [Candidatus Soleaferrea massiliensis]